MSEFIVEMLVGEVVHALPPTRTQRSIEIGIEEVSVVKNVPGSAVMEVYASPPDTHYRIGGSNPSADPSVLVWYDTLGQ